MYIIMRVLSACETYIRYNGYFYTKRLQSVTYYCQNVLKCKTKFEYIPIRKYIH